MNENRPRGQLIRSRDERVVGGVCGGLARYFDVDTVLVRIVVVALMVFGGFGALAYVAAWLLVPDEQSGRAIVSGGTDRNRSLRAVAVVVLAIAAVGTTLSWGVGFGDGGWTFFVLLMLAGVVWFALERDRPATASAGATATTAVATPAPVGAPTGDVGAAGADAGGGEPPVDPLAGEAGEPAPRERASWAVTAICAGGVFLLLGVAGALDALGVMSLGWGGFVAVAILLTGVALVASAFFGGARGLIPVGIVLAVVLGGAAAAGVSLSGGVGEAEYGFTSGNDLRGRYELGIGRLQLDVRDIDLAPGTTRVDAEVDIGMLEIVASDGRIVGGGTTWEGGGTGVSGLDVGRTIVVGDGDRTLEIDAHVGIGAIVLRERPGPTGAANPLAPGSAPSPARSPRACPAIGLARVPAACEGDGDDA